MKENWTNHDLNGGGYVIYKPWLGGVYAEYTTRGRGQRKFAAEINPERSEGFIEAANFR